MIRILERAQAISTGDQWFVPKPVIEQTLNTHLWVLGVWCFFAMLGFLYSLRLARAEKQLFPIYVFFGVGFACVSEPLNDLMAHVTYAEVGQINLWTAFGFNVPLWVFPCYLFIGGWPANWMLQRIRRGVTFKWWMTSFFAFVLAMFAVEVPGIHFAGPNPAWQYYGPQPLLVFGYPMPMAFTNAAGFIFVTAAIAHLLLSHDFIKQRQYLLMPLMAMVFFCSVATTMFPWAYSISSTPDPVVINIGGVLSILVAIFLVWFFGKLVGVPRPGKTNSALKAESIRRCFKSIICNALEFDKGPKKWLKNTK